MPGGYGFAELSLVLATRNGDAAADTVSVRFRDGDQIDGVPAVEAIDSWVSRRVNASPTAQTVL